MKQKKRAGRLSFFALLSNFRRKFERFYLKESREALFFCATSEFPKGNLEGSFLRYFRISAGNLKGSFLPDRFHDRACCLRLVHGIDMDAVCTVLL